MRLIDAEALMADLEKWLKQIDPTHPPEDNAIPPMEDIIVSALMTIEEQPTIEPQRMRGKWINNYRCSVCGYGEKNYSDAPNNFCPVFGADMRETE